MRLKRTTGGGNDISPMSAGVFFGPYVAGLIGDQAASYEASFVSQLIFAILITITAVILRIGIKKRG